MRDNQKFIGICVDANNNPINKIKSYNILHRLYLWIYQYLLQRICKTYNSFIGWNSRSMVVVVCVTNENHSKFLVEKRGPGCPDNIGKFCMPCGYLNWDETLKEAASRELYEETGCVIKSQHMVFHSINDNILNNRQNVSVRYIAYITDEQMEEITRMSKDTKSRGGEAGEIEELRIVDKEFIEKHREDFCFRHDEFILNELDI